LLSKGAAPIWCIMGVFPHVVSDLGVPIDTGHHMMLAL